MFGKDSKKKELIKHLGNIFVEIQREHGIPAGDFPNLKEMQDKLSHYDFAKFHHLKKPLLETIDTMLNEDIAKLMDMIPQVKSFTLFSLFNINLVDKPQIYKTIKYSA